MKISEAELHQRNEEEKSTQEKENTIIEASLLKYLESKEGILSRLDTNKIYQLVEDGANINFRNEHGTYPLFWAQYGMSYSNSDSTIVKILLSKGAIDFNENSSHLLNVLEGAEKDNIITIIQNGIDINSKWLWYIPWSDEDGCYCYKTPLSEAARIGRLDLIELFLLHGAKVNTSDFGFKESGSQPLGEALKNDHLEIASLLLNKGASKTTKFTLDTNYYELAVYRNDTSLLDFLIANKFPYPKDGFSPIKAAAQSNSLLFVNKLTNLSTTEQLNMALCYAGNIPIAQELIKKGADVNFQFNYQEFESCSGVVTPLIAAITKREFDLVRYLVDEGARINPMSNGTVARRSDRFDCLYTPPLIKAIEHRDFKIAEYLINNGANVNHLIFNYDDPISPLILAVKNNDVKLTELLIKSNAQRVNDSISIKRIINEYTDAEIKRLIDSMD